MTYIPLYSNISERIRSEMFASLDPKQNHGEDFNTINFWFDENVPDDSIDLLARCTNP